ncbi:MAG: crossover junction endodeoxyribonuclease RuvC [Kiritimatiellia bacterium]
MRVLGIDTSLRSTGIGVVEAEGNCLRAVTRRTIKAPRDRPVSECLRRLNEGIAEVIETTAAEEAAVEGGFYCRNVRTAMVLGEARGAAIASCASQGVAVYEYSPRRVKQAVVGTGSADKSQVRRMLMSILGLREEPGEDEGDALAIAVCHLHSRTSYQALQPESI